MLIWLKSKNGYQNELEIFKINKRLKDIQLQKKYAEIIIYKT